MEINQPASASEISNQGSPHDDQVLSQQARSYECSFCKKGFSNAQALGGHMNIHRKDKAKLKQASKGAQRLHDTPPVLANSLTPSRSNIKPLEFTSGQVKSNTKWPCIFSSDCDDSCYPTPRDGTHVADLKQLPLFMENADNWNSRIQASANWEEELHSTTQGSSFGAELDLELRLGHSPPDASVTMGTRKFF